MDDCFLSFARQIGYAVWDVDRVMENLSKMGIGHDRLNVFEVTLNASTMYMYKGKYSSCTLRIALGEFGGMDHEYIQVLYGEHPARDFLEEHGEGINHLGFYVDDIAPWISRMAQGGCETVIDGRFNLPNGRQGSFAYMAHRISPSPMFEFIAM